MKKSMQFKEKTDKFVCSEMRIINEIPIDKVVKIFAIRCAKRCLKNYEKEYPDDKRVFEAIEGAELYLDGKIELSKLKNRINAARSAESAARSAAWSAARSAEWRWQERELEKIIRGVLKSTVSTSKSMSRRRNE